MISPAAEGTPSATAAYSTSEKDILRRINVLGAISLAAVGALTLLSPVLSGGIDVWEGHGAGTPRALQCGWCNALATEANPFQQSGLLAVASVTPLVASTAIFLALWFLLNRRSNAITPEVLHCLQRWSIWFAVASVIALPVMTRDFWLSVTWGRMAVHGVNPYYVHPTPAALERLPAFDQLDTYGPLWTLISAAIAGVSFNVVWIEFLLFKLILGAAWIGSLVQIRAITASQSLSAQAASLAVFGWLPLGFHQTLAEGHNDIVMVFLCLCALRAMQQTSGSSTLLLAASACVKYVTAPLLLVDFLHAMFVGRARTYLVRIGAAAIAAAIVFAAFYRSPAFFDPASEMRSWRFMEPSSVVSVLRPVFGSFVGGLMSKAIRAGFFVIAALYLYRYMRRRTPETLNAAALAIMALMLFAEVGHVWPWFLIWLVALGALVPDTILGRWIPGVVLIYPFVQIWWKLVFRWFPDPTTELRYAWPAIAVYSVSLLWLWKAPSSTPPSYVAK